MALIKKFRIKSFKNSKSVIELKDISLSYKNRLILNKINFKINKGQILGLLGPNGVGKSTVFNIITGLLKPSHGKILMDNKDITNYSIAERSTKFNIGYVPQYGGYFHDLTLEENLYAIAEIVIREKKNISMKVENLISQFEFENITNIKAKFLSGGQKKKLVIALSLISDPKVLLLDEPFAALDVLTIKMLKELIVNLQTYNNISICLCDHQARDLLSCVDVAIILSNCKIIASGTPSQLISDSNAQAAYFGESFKLN
jgi:lipopolysaccharide export system ATP-binding protein